MAGVLAAAGLLVLFGSAALVGGEGEPTPLAFYGVLGAGVALIAVASLLGPGTRPARFRPGFIVDGEVGASLDEPTIHPTVLLESTERQHRAPRRWLGDPRRAGAAGRRVAVGLGVAALALLALATLGDGGVPALALAGLVAPLALTGLLVAAPPMVELLRTRLARGRLDVRLVGLPADATPGQALDVQIVVAPRAEVQVDRVLVGCFGLAEFDVVEQRAEGPDHLPMKRAVRWVEVIHRQVESIEVAEQLRPGRPRTDGARFELPARVAPTRERRQGRTVRWVVAASADIPGWPDAAALTELEVWRPPASQRQEASAS